MPRNMAQCRRCGYDIVTEMPEGQYGGSREMMHWKMCEPKRNWPAWTFRGNEARKARKLAAAEAHTASRVAVMERPDLEERRVALDSEYDALVAAIESEQPPEVEEVSPEMLAKRAELDAEYERLLNGEVELPHLTAVSAGVAGDEIVVSIGDPLTCPHCGKVSKSRIGHASHMRAEERKRG